MMAGTGTKPLLVGREQEFARMVSAADGAVAGRFSASVIYGESGVGKTELLRAVSAEIHGRADTVWGTCLPAATLDLPCLPLRSAIHDWAARGAPELQSDLPWPASSSAEGSPLDFD